MKNLEIVFMLVIGAGFIWQLPVALYIGVFLMGCHSTLFGPAKFAYLPQHLRETELTGGNGLVEMGTFVAILLGTMLGGALVAIPGMGPTYVAVTSVVIAVAGRIAAGFIPASPPPAPELKINWNPVTETWANLKIANKNRVVFLSMIGISWLWFFGSIFLTSFTGFAKEVLSGNEQVVTLLLATFSVGIGVGSVLCEKMSGHRVEIGLVPFGAIGMTVFAIDLYFASRSGVVGPLIGAGEFISVGKNWRIMADLFLLAMFAGFYSVPLYSLMQSRTDKQFRARIIAANNILNALFMIGSSVIAGALLGAKFTIPQIFLFTGLANAVVAFYIFMLVPEYFLRFIAWIASRFVYRFKVTGDQHIPVEGAAILTCNHVSFVDAVLLMAASPRPIRFVMDHRIFKVPVLGWMFRLAKAIPIASKSEDPVAYERAFADAQKVLQEGDLLAIFPEGGITKDGELQEFKGGIMKILETAKSQGMEPPVIPMALTNLWGSYFSRVEKGNAMVRPFRRGVFSRVGLNVGAPMAASAVQPAMLKERVQVLLKA